MAVLGQGGPHRAGIPAGQKAVGPLGLEEENIVRVLLDGARFLQVGELGPLVGAQLHLAVHLHQLHHRHPGFQGQGLEGPGGLGHLLVPAAPPGHLHQGQMVEENHGGPAFPDVPAQVVQAGGRFRHPHRLPALQQPDGPGHQGAFLIGQPFVPDAGAVQAGQLGRHPGHQLPAPHLHGVVEHPQPRRRVPQQDGQGKVGFAVAAAGRQHEHRPGQQPAHQAVQPGIAGQMPRVLAEQAGIQVDIGLRQGAARGRAAARRLLLAHHPAQGGGHAVRVLARRADALERRAQAALPPFLPQLLGVMGVARHPGHLFGAAEDFRPFLRAQVGQQGDRVGPGPRRLQLQPPPRHLAVKGRFEPNRLDARLPAGRPVHHQAPDHRAFCFQHTEAPLRFVHRKSAARRGGGYSLSRP